MVGKWEKEVESRMLSDGWRAVGSLCKFFLDPVEASFFNFIAQFGRSLFDDTPVDEHMHKVGLEIIEHALIVSDDER